MAVKAINPALAEWQALSVAQGSKYLLNFGKAIEANLAELTDSNVRHGGMTHS